MKLLHLASPSTLVIVIVCFFFTFTDLKCNDKKLISLKGIDLITGKKIDTKDFTGMGKEMKDLMNLGKDNADEDSSNESDEDLLADEESTSDESETTPTSTENADAKKGGKDIKPNPLAIAALALAIAGIVVAFATKFKTRAIAGISISLLGALALLILKITIEKSLDDKLGDSSEFAMLISFTFEFQPAFYLALIGFAIAALLFLLAYKDDLSEEKNAATQQQYMVEVEEPQTPLS